jgi:RNA polymerase sigma-70 factor (ECF subfamily)
MTYEDEQTLVEHARHDPEAFRKLYRLYIGRVYGYVAYRVKSRQDAEDITAEVFMKVVTQLARFEYRGYGSFAAWVFRIANNEVVQFFRRQRSMTVSLDDLPDIRSSQLTPDEALLLQEQFTRLAALIDTLPPRRQEVITLRFYGNLRNREIAEVLHLDEHTVASHLSRALADLRRQLEKVRP